MLRRNSKGSRGEPSPVGPARLGRDVRPTLFTHGPAGRAVQRAQRGLAPAPSSPPKRQVPVHDDFRRAIEEIKLRAPIEDVVRERVPELRRRGSLYEARCPFHEERTPSFKVSPERGTWHCFGSCSTGGDAISFVERFEGLDFREALELLARATGVELPARRRDAADSGGPDLHALGGRAARFFAGELQRPEGRAALDYLRGRGLTDATIEAFRLGYAPASGRALVELARANQVPIEDLERAGLARTGDHGRAYDFFRGRLMIPIHDLHGRVVGFGARRLSDGGEREAGPKYVNSPETALFKKSRLVYGLDRALSEVRRVHHLVLFEGYTDVMAAHQVGLTNVGAVLGTATTEDHAALVRRAGARRVTLVFDGDEAGRNAAYKALHGLLPLEIELDVVVLEGGADPCDLLLAEGADAFRARLEAAEPWLERVGRGLVGLDGLELSREVDRALDLVDRLGTPVLREDGQRRLAERMGLRPEVLREQAAGREQLQRRARGAAGRVAASAEAVAPARNGDPRFVAARPEESSLTRDPRPLKAYAGIAGALMLDPSLIPLVRTRVAGCPDSGLATVLETVLRLYEDEEAEIDVQSVLHALGEDPVRHRVVGLVEHARLATSPRALLEGELAFLVSSDLERERRAIESRIAELEQCQGAVGAVAEEQTTQELEELVHRHSALIRELRGFGVRLGTLTPTGPSR